MPELTIAQKSGVTWIQEQFKKHKGLILADIMGLGKTAQAIAIAKEVQKTLIICPAYLIGKWLDELLFWEIPGIIQFIESSKTVLQEVNIYVISYDQISRGKFFHAFLKMKFDLLVCDEIHYLKSWNSQRARRILGNRLTKYSFIANQCKKVLGLTGTPITDRLEDLYNLIIRLAPEVLKYSKKESFMMYFSAEAESTPWGMKYSGIRHEQQLQKLINPVILRRTVIEGLPPLQVHQVTLEIKDAKLKKYLKEEEEILYKNHIREADIIHAQKMHVWDITRVAELRTEITKCKIAEVVKIAQNYFDQNVPVVIYVFHRESLRFFEKAFKELSGSVQAVDGTVSAQKRHEIVKKFQNGEIQVLLATIGSLREGIDLTYSSCVIIAELDYTPAKMEQAIARLHRKGQQSAVSAFYICFKSGIDAHIMNLINNKKNMIDKILKNRR